MRRLVHRLLRAVSLAVAAACLLVTIFELWVRAGAYPAGRLDERISSIRIRDRDGRLLRESVGRDGARAQWTPLESINPLVIEATVAVEDHRFYEHHGIDEIGVMRAATSNLLSGGVVSGASTLTMQLARLVRPHARSLGGKLIEALEARRIERAVSKQTILEQYLNRAPYGAGTVGVEAASQRLFAKPNRHLSLAEAALLSGLPKSPTHLNPLVHPEAAKERQVHVLGRMLETGAITREEHDRAARQELVYRRGGPELEAMHFSDYVLSLDLEEPDVVTTLDRNLQGQVQQAVASHVESLASAGVTNAAAVVLDNRRCEIRAMVGSADYWSEPSGMVNGALARRQPGSTLKPFTFGLAFERGATPASVVADVKTEYRGPDGTTFSPQNFSGELSGPALMGAALGRSLNVPAIRVAGQVGAPALLDKLREAGFASLERPASFYGLGLTLGNGEVTLLELAQGYAALARGGLGCRALALRGQESAPPARIFSEEVAFLLTDVLSDERLRIDAFGPQNSLLLGFPVAVKTGTSTDWRDAWAVGYTDRYTVAVWSGDFEGRSMNHLAGAAGAGPLFHTLMNLVVSRDGQRPSPPEPPPGVVEIEVCARSGKLKGPSCPHATHVRIPEDKVPAETCRWHREIAIDRRNGLRAGPHCPERHTDRRAFEVLPPTYAAWQAEHAGEAPPASFSPLCPSDGPVAGRVYIDAPREGDVFVIEPGYERATQTVELAAVASAPVGRVVFRIDGRRVAAPAWPYRARWKLAPGQHTLSVAAPGLGGDEIAFEVR